MKKENPYQPPQLRAEEQVELGILPKLFNTFAATVVFSLTAEAVSLCFEAATIGTERGWPVCAAALRGVADLGPTLMLTAFVAFLGSLCLLQR